MTDRASLKVGDTIHRFDENRRVYRRDANNRAHGGPIYAEHFTAHVITGETTQSWLVGETRINKKTLAEAGRNGFGGHRWYTSEGKADDLWLAAHRHAIRELVERASAQQLRKVAEALGYGDGESPPAKEGL